MSEKQIAQSIKAFCQVDEQKFSTQDFKGTNLLIQILRESASKQSLKTKTQQLINKENDAQQLIEEISSVYSSQFDALLENPKLYGVQLEYLRSNITAAKKKITTTKQYLQKNEKNIQQLNYNSVFNKLIYNRLKAVETEVSKFQLASSFLKSKRYLDCSLSIPMGDGKSLLEENIRHKAQDLKNQLSLAVCLQLYSFCFLTGNVILPTQNTMLDRIKQNRGDWDLHQSVPNMEPHMKLYSKYKMLKQVNLKQYINSLWNFNDFQNKIGQIGVLRDAVNAAFNITKAQNLKQYIFLNIKKAISNIYLLTNIFNIYEFKHNPPPCDAQKPKIFSTIQSFYEQCQFTNPDKLQRINQFFISSIALGIIVVRKLILAEKAYQKFNIVQYQTGFKLVLNLLIAELKNTLHDVFFQQQNAPKPENIHPLRAFILKQYTQTINSSLLYFPYQLQPLRQSFRSVLENLTVVLDVSLNSTRQKIQQLKQFKSNFNFSLIKQYQTDFYSKLQAQWMITIQKHLGIFGGRIFTPVFFNQHQQIIFLTPMHKKLESLGLVPEFVSEDKKQYIKQFVLLCFNIDELIAYFKNLPLASTQLHRLILTALVLFQGRLISFCKKSYLIYGQNSLQQLQQQRADKKIVQQQQKFIQKYSNILRKSPLTQMTPVTIRRRAINITNNNTNNDNSIFSQYKVIQKIKVLIRFIQYLVCYFNHTLKQYISGVLPNQYYEIFQKKLDNFQNLNFEQSMTSKLKHISEFCGQEEENQKQLYLVIFKKITRLFFLLRIRQKIH